MQQAAGFVLKTGTLIRMRYRGLAANVFHLDLVAISHNLRTAAAALT